MDLREDLRFLESTLLEKMAKKGLAHGIVDAMTIVWAVMTDRFRTRTAKWAGVLLQCCCSIATMRETPGGIRRRREEKARTTLALVLSGIWMSQTMYTAERMMISSKTYEALAVAIHWATLLGQYMPCAWRQTTHPVDADVVGIYHPGVRHLALKHNEEHAHCKPDQDCREHGIDHHQMFLRFRHARHQEASGYLRETRCQPEEKRGNPANYQDRLTRVRREVSLCTAIAESNFGDSERGVCDSRCRCGSASQVVFAYGAIDAESEEDADEEDQEGPN